MTFHTYESFVECSGKAQPGTKNLLVAIHDLWDLSITGSIYGIYNCRPPSLHGEGRALDVGFRDPITGAEGWSVTTPNPQGFKLVEVLVKNAWDLGLVEVIWNRTRWSARHPGGYPYSGASPHLDHVHIGQAWSGARGLTLDAAYDLVAWEDMTPEQEATLNELVMVRRDLANMGSNFWALLMAVKLIRFWRKVEALHDAEDI